MKQKSMDGVSFLSTFTDPNAKAGARAPVFRILSNRAIYDHGWIAAV